MPTTFPAGRKRRWGYMADPIYPLYVGRLRKVGSSWIIPIPEDVRAALLLRPFDLVVMRIHGPYVTFRRADPELLVPLEQLDARYLPPPWPQRKKLADIRRDSPREPGAPAPATPRADE